MWMTSMGFAAVAFVAAVVVGWLLPRPTSAEDRRLQRQLHDLHRRLQALEAERTGAVEGAAPAVEARPEPEPGPAPEPEPTPEAVAVPPVEAPVDPAPAEVVPSRARWQPPSAEKVAVWIGATLGAVALAIGALLGLVAAVEAGWVGPGLRVAAGLVGGTTAWVGSLFAWRRSRVAASALSGAGATAVFGAVWAATSLYHLVPTAVGFPLLVVVVGAAMLQAARRQDRFLGVLATLGGLAASLLLGVDDPALRAGYALVLSSGVLALAARRQWAELPVIVTLGIVAQWLAFTLSGPGPEHQATALIALGLLGLGPAAAAARTPDPATAVTATLAAMTYPLLAALWVVPVDPVFYDPRTGLAVATVAQGPWGPALALALLPVPLWWAARHRDHTGLVLAGALAALPAALAFAGGWTEPHPARALLPVALLAVGRAATTERPRQAPALLPLLLVGLTPLVASPPVGAALIATVAFVALTTLGRRGPAPEPLAALGLPVAALTLLRAADAEGALPVPVALATVAALALHQAAWLRRTEGPTAVPLGWLAALVAPAAFFPALRATWSAALGDEAIGLLPLLLAAVALAGTAVAQRRHGVARDSLPFAVGVAVALGGLTLALPLQLELRWLTLGLALEAAALASLSRQVPHPLLRWGALGLAAVVAARLLLNPWALTWGSADGWPILNWTLYTWGVPILALLHVARVLRHDLAASRGAGHVAAVLPFVAMLLGFALVNVQVSHAFQSGTSLTLSGTTLLQGTVRSLAWGGYGMALLFAGLGGRSRPTRFVGFGFVLLAACKVFLYDLWSLPGFLRVGSLLGLGLFLMVAAFLFERLVLRERPSPVTEAE